MGSVLRFSSFQVIPIQALEQGNVEQERAQRNWGYIVDCAAFVVETPFAQENEEKNSITKNTTAKK